MFALAQVPTSAARPAVAPPAVAVVSLTRRQISLWHAFSGQVEAVAEVEVRARVAGAIAGVHFREGSLVRAGDLLVTIDQAPYCAELARAQAALAAAEAKLEFAAAQQRRAARLIAERAIAQVEMERLSNAEQLAHADLASARAALESVRLNLNYTQIRAPIAGKVGHLAATPGNLVSAGPQSPVLTTLVSVNPVYAAFDIDEAALRQLVPAGDAGAMQAVRVLAESGNVKVEGKLHAIGNRFNGSTGTVRARALFEHAGQMIPGQFVRLRMRAAQPVPALLAPESAIGTDQDKRFVYLAGADGTVAYREVQLGAASDGLRVVSSGLNEGDRLILDRLQQIKPGDKVTPVFQ